MSRADLFADVAGSCICGESEGGCPCGRYEAAVCRYAEGRGMRPMTPAEREAVIADVLDIGEGCHARAALSGMGDQELAGTLLHAWSRHVESLF